MFDDMVVGKTKIRESAKSHGCPVCSSYEVNPIDGVFVAPKQYVQTVECVVCMARWHVTYDADLNVVEIKVISGGC